MRRPHLHNDVPAPGVYWLNVQINNTDVDEDGDLYAYTLAEESSAPRVSYIKPRHVIGELQHGINRVKVRVESTTIDGDGDMLVEMLEPDTEDGTEISFYVFPTAPIPLITVPLDTIDDVEAFLNG